MRDGRLLVRDHVNGLWRHARGKEHLAHHVRNLGRAAPAGVVVALEHVAVEVPGGERRDLADVLVAAVAGGGEDGDPPPADLQLAREVHHHAHRVRVVGVVQDDLEGVLVEDVEAARRLVVRRGKGAEAVADVVQPDPLHRALAQGVGDRGGEHRVLHVVRRLALDRRRDEVRPDQRDVPPAVVDRDHVPVHARLQDHGAAPGADVLAHDGVLRVHRHVADRRGAGVLRHREAPLVVGVEDGAVLGHLNRDALDLRQVVQRVDPADPEVVRADVEDRRHVARLKAQPSADHPASGGLQNRAVHVGVAEHHARACRPGHVAFDREAAVDVDAVARGHARRVARHLRDVRHHPRGRGLAVGAGDARDGDARGRPRGEEQVHDRPGHVARRALGGRHVHAEAGRRVALHDRAAHIAPGLRDVGRQEVHAAHVQPDGLDRALGHVPVVRMHHVRQVDGRSAGGEVGGGAEVQRIARG